MRIGNDDFIAAGTQTDMTISFESIPIWLGHICNYSIQLFFSGSPNGALRLQCSLDEGSPSSAPTTNYAQVTHWSDILGSSQLITTSGDHVWEVTNTGNCWVRFVWSASSGSGTLTSARFNIKGI